MLLSEAHPAATEVSLPNDLPGGLAGAYIFRPEGYKTREPWVSAYPVGSLNRERQTESVTSTCPDSRGSGAFRTLDTHQPRSVFQMPFAFYKQETEVQRGQATCTTAQSKLEASPMDPVSSAPPWTEALRLASSHSSGEPWLLHLRGGGRPFTGSCGIPDRPLTPF